MSERFTANVPPALESPQLRHLPNIRSFRLAPPPVPHSTRPEFGVYAELPATHYITFVFGPGSTPEHGQKLTEALRHIARYVGKYVCVAQCDYCLVARMPAEEPQSESGSCSDPFISPGGTFVGK